MLGDPAPITLHRQPSKSGMGLGKVRQACTGSSSLAQGQALQLLAAHLRHEAK